MNQNVAHLTDGSLNNWGINFVAQLESSPLGPADFGIPDAMATEFTAAQSAYATAYAASQNQTTRGPSTIQGKDDARRSFVEVARRTIKQAEIFPGLTDQQRIDLRIPIPDSSRTPVEPPETKPRLQIVSVQGHLVKLQVLDENNKRRRPRYVSGYNLFMFVGDTPPNDIAAWKFVAGYNKLDTELTLPLTLPVGTKVWLTCAWVNRKLEAGPACDPVMTGPTFGGLSQAA